MTSETFQTFVASSRAWLTIRDVIEVDGIKIDDREDIRALLHDSSAPGLALKLAQRNARFNLGSVSRNFNEPTLGLLVLEPERRPQFRFERRRVEQTAGAPLVTLSFKEVDRPTLIRSVAGPSVYSTGELLIEADTGRIEKTTIRFKHESILASLTTEYTHDAKLEMWVPGIFKERYEQTRAPREVVECESRYTNYRRFDVTSRIR